MPSGVARGVASGVPDIGERVGWKGATYVDAAGLIGAESVVICGNDSSVSSSDDRRWLDTEREERGSASAPISITSRDVGSWS